MRLSPYFSVRRQLAALLCTAGLLVCAGTVQAAPLAEIRDPHYGDTLFTFFQDHYFQSITELMVSQHFNRVSHHSEEAEVLRGGMLLSYGMQREAGEIFERLIALGATPATQDRAWFFLGKIRYQRGYTAQAQDALARIGTHLAPELQEELGLLQAQVRMAAGDYAAAAQSLSVMDQKTPGARYVRFNLGVALVRSGQGERGTAVLDALGQAPAENEEYRDLRDRANLALGFAALAAQQPAQARNYLERVRLKSLQANKALLGLGWAASSQQQSRLALVPWLELIQRDVGDAAVLEAFIAAPHAYAELGAYSQAAQGYERAIATFATESAALDASIAALRTGALLQQLVDSNPGGDMGWFWGLKSLPDMPEASHASHLAHVLAQHDFQEALKNYRDLLFLQRNLQQWNEQLGTLDDMLSNRRKAFAQRLPAVAERASASTLAAGPLRQRHQALAATVAQAQADADGLAFADSRERGLLERVQRLQAAIDAAPLNADSAALAERARMAAGLLRWNLAQDYPARLWQAQSALQSAQAGLATAQQRDADLRQAQQDEPARFAAFAQRIGALSARLPQQLAQVADVRSAQQQALQDLAVAALQRQQQTIAAYATQARFALAQLLDRSTSGAAAIASPTATQEAEHATKP